MSELHKRYKTLRHTVANNLHDMIIEGCSVDMVEDQLQFFVEELVDSIVIKQLMEGK